MKACLLLAVFAVAAPIREPIGPSDPPPKPPQEMIYGDWLCTLVNKNPSVQRNMIFRITPTETLFIINGQTSQGDGLTATYKVDFTQTPIAIDFFPRQRGGKMPGIIRLEGDVLILGLRTSGDKRPIDFTNADLVAHYKRVR
ncbi:MAG: hypothetical protein HYR84_03450 [Planctomycetes bacterium]|nr:hypothetical protein [Planctomycetota bacterium]